MTSWTRRTELTADWLRLFAPAATKRTTMVQVHELARFISQHGVKNLIHHWPSRQGRRHTHTLGHTHTYPGAPAALSHCTAVMCGLGFESLSVYGGIVEGGGACRWVVRQAQQIREATGIYEDNRHVKRLRGQRLEVQSGGGGGGATDSSTPRGRGR